MLEDTQSLWYGIMSPYKRKMICKRKKVDRIKNLLIL